MKNLIAVAPARPVARALVLAVATAVAVVAGWQGTGVVHAEQKKAPAKGKPAPKPAPQQAAPEQPQLIYSPWTKFCLKGQEANAKQVCFTGKDGRLESGMPVVAAVLIEPDGEPPASQRHA